MSLSQIESKILNAEFKKTLSDHGLALHVVDSTNFKTYARALSELNVCNAKHLGRAYETLSYASLQDKGTVGLFLAKPGVNSQTPIIVTALILDNSSKSKTVELGLLCSNKDSRVPGITTKLMNRIPSLASTLNVNTVKLKPTEVSKSFYTGLGYVPDVTPFYTKRIGGKRRTRKQKYVRFI